jgi:hypothetical protein
MKNHVSRAMVVSMLEIGQLERLQDRENTIGHQIANWNVLDAFRLRSLKETYHIPDDLDLQGRHAERIERELENHGWKEEGHNLDALHVFDFKIFNGKDNIVWDFSAGSKYGRNIKDELK